MRALYDLCRENKIELVHKDASFDMPWYCDEAIFFNDPCDLLENAEDYEMDNYMYTWGIFISDYWLPNGDIETDDGSSLED